MGTSRSTCNGSKIATVGAARLGYGRCPCCHFPRRQYAAPLSASRVLYGCLSCVTRIASALRTRSVWERLARAAQAAERGRAAARAARAVQS